MDWDDIRSFLAIARARTLSGAARELGLRQSTMSRRLEALEQRAGARLLQKTPRGYDLTALGEAVLANAERMEMEAIAVERVVQGRDVALSGVIRVTTVDTIASWLLPPAIAALQARYPAISVEVLPETRSLSLSKREADLAIRMARFEGNELVSRRVALLGHALYASPAYLAAHDSPLDAGGHGGSGHAIITVLEDQAHLPEARWLVEQVPHARIALGSNSREVQLSAARAGLGIVCLSRYLADREPGLTRITAAGPGPQREMWLGVHADLRHMPRIRALIDTLDSEIAAQRGLLNPD
jgi:DNA-binding transcriptional LysR family regulator